MAGKQGSTNAEKKGVVVEMEFLSNFHEPVQQNGTHLRLRTGFLIQNEDISMPAWHLYLSCDFRLYSFDLLDVRSELTLEKKTSMASET